MADESCSDTEEKIIKLSSDSSEEYSDSKESVETKLNIEEINTDTCKEPIRKMEIFKAPAELSLIGNLKENWRKFKQHYNIFMTATNRYKEPKETQVAILLSLLGEAAIETYNTFDMADEDKKEVAKVMKAFEDYCNPRKNIVYERYVFYSRNQGENEPFDQFLTDISKLIKSCEFDVEPTVDSILRDRIVLGHHDRELQERMLRMEKLDLKGAIEICRVHEVTNKQNQEVQGSRYSNNGVRNNCDEIHAGAMQGNKKSATNINTSKRFVTNTNKNKFSNKKITNNNDKINCTRCLTKHEIKKCPAYRQECKKCGKLNHFARACKNKFVREVCLDEQYVNSISIFNVKNMKLKKKYDSCWFEKIKVENKIIEFKLDTGSEVNIIPLSIFNKINQKFKIRKKDIKLEAYGGFQLKSLGVVSLRLEFKNQMYLQDCIIADVPSLPILGIHSCVTLGLIKRIDAIANKVCETKEEFVRENIVNFTGLGKFPKLGEIELKDNAIPVAKPPRRIPLTIVRKVKQKLAEMVKSKIISKVENTSEWIHNLVVVEKKDKSLRLCLDPHELNLNIKRNYTLMPTIEDLSHQLQNMEYFTVLDLKEGFWQIELTEKAKEYCTFSTPFGCYRFNRLPFGVASAPELFQYFNTSAFGDLKGVFSYMDDILVYGKNKEEHDRNLKNVMNRAKEINVKFNKEKIQYRVKEVSYLGHKFSKKGIESDPDRIKAIRDLDYPQNKEQLMSFLGTINYLRNFIPNLAELSAPLRNLLKKNVVYQWFPNHSKVVDDLKRIISDAPILQNFDPTKTLVIEADSSKYGVGCVLLQDDKPIFYASKSLTDTEVNYSQTEKEFLAILYACKRFHYFVYGLENVIVHTDHKPLVSIMQKELSKIHSVRLQRMKIKLFPYKLELKYVPGKQMHISDFLSRNFLRNDTNETIESLNEMVHSVNISYNRKDEIREKTEEDSDFKRIIDYCQKGWPADKSKVQESIKIYYKNRNEIYFENGLLFFQDRIMIPKTLHAKILGLLHESHMGITKTLARAKALFYWPNLNSEVERLVLKCRTCEKYRASNSKEPMIAHEVPDIPFQVVGCDILDYAGSSYLIMIDYFSKYLEIIKLKDKTSLSVIDAFKKIFSCHGIPEKVVCDNMPFNSYDCKVFSDHWNFAFQYSSPRYPRSNGMAEKAVHISKNILRKSAEENKDFYTALLEYRCTPLVDIGYSPAQILMNRQLRSKLPVAFNKLKPEVPINVKNKLIEKQNKMKKYYNKSVKPRKHEFRPGDNVVYQHDTKFNKKWYPAKIVREHKNPRSFYIENENYSMLRRNTINIRKSLNRPSFRKSINIPDQTKNSNLENLNEQNVENTDNALIHNNEQTKSPTYRTRYGRKIVQPERFNY